MVPTDRQADRDRKQRRANESPRHPEERRHDVLQHQAAARQLPEAREHGERPGKNRAGLKPDRHVPRNQQGRDEKDRTDPRSGRGRSDLNGALHTATGSLDGIRTSDIN